MQYENNPGMLLRQMASKNIEASENHSVAKDFKNTWSGVGFSMCGQALVAPIGEVVEIIPVPKFTLVPAVKPWVMGIANVRGRLLPIIDTEQFFGAKLTGTKNNHRVLIVETSNSYVGLVVSKVFGLKHFDSDTCSPRDESDDSFAGFVDTTFTENNQRWYRFSPAALVLDKEFKNASLTNGEQAGLDDAAA